MITIYLDMDGVLCHFDKAFRMDIFDKHLFKQKVMVDKLFETLDYMPNTVKFLDWIDQMYGIDSDKFNFQVLSSLGAPTDYELQDEVARQKRVWLDKNFGGIPANYVIHKGFKKHFAHPHAILIDDTPQNIFDFNERHGHGLLYQDDYFDKNKDAFVKLVDKIELQIKEEIYGRSI